MKALAFLWKNLEEICTTFIFIVLLIVVFVQVAGREIFGNPLIFTEELARYLYIWLLFTGIGLVIKKRRNIALDLIVRSMGGARAIVFDIISNIVSLGVFVFLIYWSIQFVIFSIPNPAPAMQFSLGILYIIGPVSLVIGAIRLIQVTVEDFIKLKNPDAESVSAAEEA